MPPKKKAKALQEIALTSVANVVNNLCIGIEHEFGGWGPDSHDKLMAVKIYLSAIRPMFDDLFGAVLDLCFTKRLRDQLHDEPVEYPVVKDKYLILDLFMSDRLRTLDLRKLDESNDCFSDDKFWANHLLKLNNVVELDIKKVPLTEKAFQAIGDVCTHLRKIRITANVEYASMNSLLHILKCRELQDVAIRFCDWEDKSESEYTKMILTGLPKLEYFQYLEDFLILNHNYDRINTPLTSMSKVSCKMVTSAEIRVIIRLCPNLTDMVLTANDDGAFSTTACEESTRVLKYLANSSLQFNTLCLNYFSFGPQMTRLITSNCSNLTLLRVNDCEGRRINVNDIYTIGVSCPKIEDLGISDSNDDTEAETQFIQLHSPDMEDQIFDDTTPRMFVHLKGLQLHSNLDWDPRILPLILRHGNDLTDISLGNIFKPTRTTQDVVSDLLNISALRELRSLHLEFESYDGEIYTRPLLVDSIERLLDSCPNLSHLNLTGPMQQETIQYLRELKANWKSLNFEFSLEFCQGAVSSSDSE